MKKFTLLVLLSGILLCSACGNSASAPSSSDSTSEEVNLTEEYSSAVESLQDTIQDAINDIADNYSPQPTTDSLDSLCTFMEESGLVSGERIEMAGEMIGAISGVKYKDCNVEIYEYNTTSDSYNALISDGKIIMEGFNIEVIPSAIHEQYVLICDEAPNKDALISAFNNLP